MKYLTTNEISKIWGISDRRVRILCANGRIDGAILVGKTYLIPEGSEKPIDGRRKVCESSSEASENKNLAKYDILTENESASSDFNLNFKLEIINGIPGMTTKRIENSTSIESELAAHALSKLFKVKTLPVTCFDENSTFTAFPFNSESDKLIGLDSILGQNSSDPFLDFLIRRPLLQKDFAKMVAFDFIIRMEERDFSKTFLIESNGKESFYPLAFNGKSLFFDSNEELISRATKNPVGFSSKYGMKSHYEMLIEIAKCGVDFRKIMNLDVSEEEIRACLSDAGVPSEKLGGSMEWIQKCIEILKRC